ncbi:MAG TPA: hypothetical protein VN841_29165 [Bryobacteraceae bacterium]|nr:hypothetical protein [Bryobacteraceae bacterium]
MENVWLKHPHEAAPVEVHTQEELVKLMVQGYQQCDPPAAAGQQPAKKAEE